MSSLTSLVHERNIDSDKHTMDLVKEEAQIAYQGLFNRKSIILAHLDALEAQEAAKSGVYTDRFFLSISFLRLAQVTNLLLKNSSTGTLARKSNKYT